MTGHLNIHALLHDIFHRIFFILITNQVLITLLQCCYLILLCCVIFSMLNCFLYLTLYLADNVATVVKGMTPIRCFICVCVCMYIYVCMYIGRISLFRALRIRHCLEHLSNEDRLTLKLMIKK